MLAIKKAQKIRKDDPEKDIVKEKQDKAAGQLEGQMSLEDFVVCKLFKVAWSCYGADSRTDKIRTRNR